MLAKEDMFRELHITDNLCRKVSLKDQKQHLHIAMEQVGS